ncbi:MAG: leucine-rich repeat domain-containing protein [Clostridiales bacterium]|nr:leucine-rich repeat domain-containing protein [Clostridiales bacterium]
MSEQWNNYSYKMTDEGVVILQYRPEEAFALPDGTEDVMGEDIAIIPSSIEGSPVVEIGEEAFTEHGALLSKIEVPSTVKRIGKGAFKMCMSLMELVLHDGLEEIGAEAFYLTPLTEIALPDTMRVMEEPWEMSAIRILVSPEHPCFFTDGFCLYRKKEAEQELLVACQQEERTVYRVADGTTVIGESAFAGNEMLERVMLPGSVHTIRASAFEECRRLREVVLPETDLMQTASKESMVQNLSEEIFGLRCIGELAFSHCICLKEIYLPSTVEKIGRFALSDTFGWSETLIGLEKITVSAANIHFTADENALFEIGGNNDRYLVKYFGLSSAYQIPADVTRILPGAFRRAKFRKCRIPKSVQDVGKDAFRECTALEELELEESGMRLYVPRQPVYRKDEITELFYSAEREERLQRMRTAEAQGEQKPGRWSILDFPEKWRDFAAYYPKPRYEMAARQGSVICRENTMREKTVGRQDMMQEETAGGQYTMDSGRRFVYDYRGYDALFPTYLSLPEKCGMACCRLKYPVCLSEENAEEYRMFVAENLTDILRDVSKTQDIDHLALLAELVFFTEDNIGACLDVFARTGATKCTGFLLNY